MSGIIMLLVIAIWAVIVIFIHRAVAAQLPVSRWKGPLSVFTFIVLLGLPLVDEIIGGFQFKYLCAKNSSIQVDKETARGKTVYYSVQPAIKIKWTAVDIWLQPMKFVDVETDNTVVLYNELRASSGVLSRRFTESNLPFIFKGYCVPKDRPGSVKTFLPFGIHYVEPLEK